MEWRTNAEAVEGQSTSCSALGLTTTPPPLKTARRTCAPHGRTISTAVHRRRLPILTSFPTSRVHLGVAKHVRRSNGHRRFKSADNAEDSGGAGVEFRRRPGDSREAERRVSMGSAHIPAVRDDCCSAGEGRVGEEGVFAAFRPTPPSPGAGRRAVRANASAYNGGTGAGRAGPCPANPFAAMRQVAAVRSFFFFLRSDVVTYSRRPRSIRGLPSPAGISTPTEEPHCASAGRSLGPIEGFTRKGSACLGVVGARARPFSPRPRIGRTKIPPGYSEGKSVPRWCPGTPVIEAVGNWATPNGQIQLLSNATPNGRGPAPPTSRIASR